MLEVEERQNPKPTPIEGDEPETSDRDERPDELDELGSDERMSRSAQERILVMREPELYDF